MSSWKELKSKLFTSAYNQKIPIGVSFELTPRCNLRCKMCYVRHSLNDQSTKERELTTEQWLQLAQEAKDAGMLFLALTGGEVLLREDFKLLYENFVNMGLMVQFISNGTMITSEIVNFLAALPPYRVDISLYGASAATYQKVTGYGAGFDKALHAIDSLLNKGIATAIRTTLIKENKDDFDALFDLAQQRQLDLGLVSYIFPAREKIDSDPQSNRLHPKDLAFFLKRADQRYKEAGDEKSKPESLSKTSLVDGSAFSCHGGSCTCWLTWTGKMLPCGLFDAPDISPLKVGFKNAWAELKEFCHTIPIAQECNLCRFKDRCGHCPARLYRETGTYNKPAPYLCTLAQASDAIKA